MGLPVVWIELDQVERVRAELMALPEKRLTRVPCKRAIELLSEELRGLSGKGYSRKEIAEELTKKGLAVSETVLRSYLRGGGEKRLPSRGRGVARKSRKADAGAGQGGSANGASGGDVPHPEPAAVARAAAAPESAPVARKAEGGRTAGGLVERKSQFVVRKDTEDL
jgi:hypothetical protein